MGWLNQLISYVRISKFLIVELSALILLRMAQIFPALDVVANVLVIVEVLAQITTRLLDFLVGIGLAYRGGCPGLMT